MKKAIPLLVLQMKNNLDLGDKIEVKLKSVNEEKREIDFTLS